VKMSNSTAGRFSALCATRDATSIVILPAQSDFCEGRQGTLMHAGPAWLSQGGISAAFFCTLRLRKHQFLFDTNERFSLSANFATPTKQSTSFFLFSTNERPPITTHRQFRWPKTSLCSGAHRSTFSQTIYLLAGDDEGSGQNPSGRNDAAQRKPLKCHGFEIFR